MISKEYYRNYLADNEICDLNKWLSDYVLMENPNHVFEFGCGTGKNLALILKMQSQFAKSNIAVSGLDISLKNLLHANIKNDIQHVSIGDETHLRHYCNFDVVITVSVLDHIDDIDGIIQELKRIANKAVIIAECAQDHGEHYYAHDFTQYGFERLERTKYYSEADNHIYWLYRWRKNQDQILSMNNFVNGAKDDFAH